MESCLYTPDQILDFVANLEVNLKAVRDTLKARSDPSKRCTFCLFVRNYGGAMSIPTDLPYCLIYPMNYVRDRLIELYSQTAYMKKSLRHNTDRAVKHIHAAVR